MRLLRLLQHKDIETPGGGKPIKVNVRMITASEKDLVRKVQSGAFREDLYFRLSILPISLPPLRQRKQDIIAIAEYFIDKISVSEGLLAKALSKDAERYLIQQSWSGNVRELENLIHRALVLSDDDTINAQVLQHIHEASNMLQPVERRAIPALHINLRHPDGQFKTMEKIEIEALHMVLQHFDNNITRASEVLGMAKSTFYRKIKDA